MDIYSSHTSTLIHPLAALIVMILGITILTVQRKHATLPMLLLACFIPSAQRIVVAGIDFDLLRILVLFGWLRIILMREIVWIKWITLDYLILAWCLSTIFFHTWQQGTTVAFISKLGSSFDKIGFYFYFRSVIRTIDDVKNIAKHLSLIAIPVVVFFMVEWQTGYNLFSVFGGVPIQTVIRDGRLRVQGAFSHPILAGCFWAVIFPMMISFWRCKRNRQESLLMAIGVVSAVIIIFLTASSTPLMGFAMGLLALLIFPLRTFMGGIRIAILTTIIGLHLMMKAPVWHLIARVNLTGSSTGYHRFHLIDQTITHFSEWWLKGVVNIDHWNIFANDITNQYVAEGISGGFITLIIFMILIAASFSAIGKSLKVFKGNKEEEFFIWSIGVSIFVHCMNFIGVTYFGQINMLWYLSLGLSGVLSSLSTEKIKIKG